MLHRFPPFAERLNENAYPIAIELFLAQQRHGFTIDRVFDVDVVGTFLVHVQAIGIDELIERPLDAIVFEENGANAVGWKCKVFYS